jgi:protein TonB
MSAKKNAAGAPVSNASRRPTQEVCVSHAGAPQAARAIVRSSPLLLQSLALVTRRKEAGRSGRPFTVSVLLHVALAFLVVLAPLLTYDTVPAQDVSGFFTEPLAIAAPPPPPPSAPSVHKMRHAAPRSTAPGFLAPLDVTSPIEPDALDLGPAGGEGGVDGGVPDGLVGAIVGGLPPSAPPAPARVVRISSYAAPRLVRKVAPIYPDLALNARVSGVVLVEADVDTRGSVTMVRVQSGHPLLEAAAVEAVRQWRYQPLLLNGEPTAFIVTVSITFTLNQG